MRLPFPGASPAQHAAEHLAHALRQGTIIVRHLPADRRGRRHQAKHDRLGLGLPEVSGAFGLVWF